MSEIHRAAYDGDVEQLRRELAAGVSPNARLPQEGAYGTPLFCVCCGAAETDHAALPREFADYVTCCKILLEAGANVNARDDFGDLPIYYTANNIVSGQGGHQTEVAVELMRILVEAGADVQATGGTLSRTSLHSVARTGRVDAITLLLKAGARVNARDADNRTPLFFAMVNNKSRAFPVLLRFGADLPAQTELTELQDYTDDRYLRAVIDAGGFGRYAQRHLSKLMLSFAPKLSARLPPELVRTVLGFWLHAGYY